MVCARCGANNPPEALYCYRCGTAMARAETPQPTPGYYPQPAPPPPATGYNPAYGAYQPPAAPGYPQPWYGQPLAPGADILQYHPLAEGAMGLPPDVQSNPKLYYSYVNTENRLVFARRVGFWLRAGAALIDLIIVGLPYFCIAGAIGVAANPSLNRQNNPFDSNAQLDPALSGWIFLMAVILFSGYYLLTGLSNGQSVGKKALKIRVMRLDGRKPDWLTVLVRFLLGYLLSINLLVISLIALLAGTIIGNNGITALLAVLAFGWGFWSVGWDELKQGWHDKLARTLVVDIREYIEGVHFYIPSRSW